MTDCRWKRGFTLIELALIIVIIGIVGTIALRSMQPVVEQTRQEATIREMQSLKNAIVGDPNLVSDGVRSDFGYLGDIGSLPPDLDALVTNPGGYSTWKGPYIQNDFVENTDDYKKDAWAVLYDYSGGNSIISEGGGAPLTIQLSGSVSELTSNTVSGNVYDGLGAGPGGRSLDVVITIYYPDGAGEVSGNSVSPGPDGYFSFENSIPIGNHLITAIYAPENDTTARYVSVPPRSDIYCEMRFSGALW